MKVLLFVCFVLFVSIKTNAQFSYEKLAEKQQFNKIQKKILKRYKKQPEDVVVNFDYAVLLSFNNFNKFNIDSAYNYAKRTELFYQNSLEKEKLKSKLITEESIQNLKLTICKKAYNRSKSENTIESYSNFISIFKDDHLLLDSAIINRNKLAFKQATELNTIEAFDKFITIYPLATEISTAIQKRNKLAFEKAQTINTIHSFQDFINTYPSAEDVENAKNLRDLIAYSIADSLKTSTAFNEFISTYPKSKLYTKAEYERDKYLYLEQIIPENVLSHINFLKNNTRNKYREVITDSLYYISKRQENLQGLNYLIEKYEYDKLKDSIWYYYYKVFTNDGYPQTYSTFRGLYEDDFPFIDLLNEEYEISTLAEDLNFEKGYNKIYETEYRNYICQASDKYLAFQVLQLLIKPYIDKKNWKEALNLIYSFQSCFRKSNKYVNQLIELLKSSDKNIKSVGISSSINSPGGEYVPVISADNKYLYFCGSNRSDSYEGEDIFIAKNNHGSWLKPEIISDLSTEDNDAPLSISTDGNRMLIFKNGDLFYSDRTIFGWSPLEAFPAPVNSTEWDADAIISSDGNAIMFSSTRKDVNKGTGVDLLEKENIDIYVCLKTEKGWSTPINLGPKINTRFEDRQPYLHSDLKTLYFSSNGHGGIGGLDVFKVTRLSDTSWTEWSDPINLGKEINTTDMDWGYKISTDGKLAYFSAIKNGNNDIYTVELPIYLRPGFVATISGKLKDKNDKPVESTIKWEDLETGKIVGESKSNPADGSFFIVLPLGKVYGYFIDKNEYYPMSNNIDLRTEKEAVEMENDIEIVTFKQMIDEGIAVPINNLFFPLNKAILLPESISELNRVAEIIKLNNLKVEIAGHTDNIGSEEYNQDLSERRAKAVRDYLIDLGVPNELMTIIGYGTKKPIASNETEQGKAKNRRVEMKFIQ